ncbi:hypothetical protein [Litoribacter ruber]|uniref:hypothetical protein n=1 Tax=Litoribacter ruber TaxID=702568 RepID=UPI001BD329CA|nr:hypothetical protein [Litoribacter alkaliphilus]
MDAKINIEPYPTNIALGESGRFNVVALPMNRLGRFFVEIDIYALNPFQTTFLALIEEQQVNTGNIFDAMPYNLVGNIVNLSDESDKVLGTFSTAHHKYDYRMVNRTNYYSANRDLAYRVETLPISNYCVAYYTEGTMEVPKPFQQIIYDH